MSSYITCCYSDWRLEVFERGVMRIRKGVRTEEPIRRDLRVDEAEGEDFYVKPDPDFDNYTYSRCHRKLREVIQVGDLLFFRSLWRGQQYLIGYFTITDKSESENGPVLHSCPDFSRLIDFNLPIDSVVARCINPDFKFRDGVHPNHSLNAQLGRNYKRIHGRGAQALHCLVDMEVSHELYGT